MLKINDIPLDNRPREILIQRGREQLRIEEIIAILIGSGVFQKSSMALATEILQSVSGDLDRLGRLNPHDLMKFRGIGVAKAAIITAALELGRRRFAFTALQEVKSITSSQDAYRLLRAFLADLGHEEFWVIHLNRASRVLHKERISSGGIAGTAVDVKLILKAAIDLQASALILAHNHPSGQLKPSEADRLITKKIKEACLLMEIQVVDHLIISHDGFVSFADEGWL